MRPGVVIAGWQPAFRAIPYSRHTIEIVSVEDVGMHLVTKEHGGVIRGLRHYITVEPLDDRRCRYIDRIEIDAGILTPVTVWFAGELRASSRVLKNGDFGSSGDAKPLVGELRSTREGRCSAAC